MCAELDRDSIQIRRVTSVLDRLFATEDESFKSFFNNEKRSNSIQFIKYIAQAGEILSIGKGYYSLPPERTIKFNDSYFVGVSVLSENNSKSLGTGELFNKSLTLNLEIEQYFHFPSFEELFLNYEKKASPLLDSNLELNEFFYFTKGGIIRTQRIKNAKENRFHLLKMERVFTHARKPEVYLAVMRNGEWFGAKIDSNSHYRRLLIGLSSKAGHSLKYEIKNLDNGCSILQVPSCLPHEEHFLLRLIAVPEKIMRPRRYLFMNEHKILIEEILKNSCLEKEGE